MRRGGWPHTSQYQSSRFSAIPRTLSHASLAQTFSLWRTESSGAKKNGVTLSRGCLVTIWLGVVAMSFLRMKHEEERTMGWIVTDPREVLVRFVCYGAVACVAIFVWQKKSRK